MPSKWPPHIVGLGVLVTLLTGGAGVITAQRALPDTLWRVADRILSPFLVNSGPGCAIAIVQDDRLAGTRSYGLADLEAGTPLTSQSVMHVASLSKQFTAFGIAILIAEGRLTLDAPIRQFIPTLPAAMAPVTIRHLLTHTSGVRDQWNLLALAGWQPDEPRTQAQVLWLLERQRALNFPPGSRWMYSNSGYSLLAEVVRVISGQPFAEFMSDRVFMPLGMTRTLFQADHDRVVPDRARGYEPEESGWRTSSPVFDTYGATGLLTTVEDLSRWAINLMTPRVQTAAVRLVRDEPGFPFSPPFSYGFGVVHWSIGGRPGIGHGGSDEGFVADILMFTEDHVATISLCNASTASPFDVNPALAQVVLADRWLEPQRSASPRRVAPALPPVVAPTTAERNRIAGRYHSEELDVEWQIVPEGDSLVVVRPRGFRQALTVITRDSLQLGPYTVRVQRNGGRILGLSLTSDRVVAVEFARVP